MDTSGCKCLLLVLVQAGHGPGIASDFPLLVGTSGIQAGGYHLRFTFSSLVQAVPARDARQDIF